MDLNPEIQRPSAIISFLPWGLADRIESKVLGRDKLKFRFQTEDDLQAVLRRAPFHYKRWMLVIQRWESSTSASFPSDIPFWIHINDLPCQFWTQNNLKAIGRELGVMVDQVTNEGRVRVQINALKPLITKKTVKFRTGEEAPVVFEYENLEKHCFHCLLLSHEEKDCPKAPQRALEDPRILGVNQQKTIQKLESRRLDDIKLSREPFAREDF